MNKIRNVFLQHKTHVEYYDPVYAEVIIRRWEEFTGQNAVKLE